MLSHRGRVRYHDDVRNSVFRNGEDEDDKDFQGVSARNNKMIGRDDGGDGARRWGERAQRWGDCTRR